MNLKIMTWYYTAHNRKIREIRFSVSIFNLIIWRGRGRCKQVTVIQKGKKRKKGEIIVILKLK